jgi:hypothetical protein
MLHVIGAVPLQLPCVDVADTNVKPPVAVNVSTTVTLLAASGPLFVTTTE